ncbi:hypothetical protein P691DRAFT_776813 [Macrolepiota fuliginosa MF-IS2]|uniref:Uncharacterized protein n=1 Tax=Macrolepiota fuliginosa MF-IS2 TaxID=1400762 RepID=A0A9P6C0E3_9AGAR|nr:hypothetical protein P691DRAFT_776813 [Macrolepiota fuliginosa MF-IS2]
MAFKLFTTFIALAAVVTAGVAQSDLASCDFVFTPDVPVDPAVTNVVADFNFITGRELAIASPTGEVFVQGSTFTENPDDVFSVHNDLSAVDWTCAQVSEFFEGLPAQGPFEGPSGVNWNIETAVCACGN